MALGKEIQQLMSERKDLIDQVINDYFEQIQLADSIGITNLRKSMEYSSIRGGKRFRPVLCLLFAEAFGAAPKAVLPLACAIEFIHTYSLIHDDLPSMDNDDLRRGEPTNHKVFGEATALLAGDALLTEAFCILAEGYRHNASVGLDLISLLSKAAGFSGMVGGQATDIHAKSDLPNLESLTEMHAMKTGALIRIACEGSALAIGLPTNKVQLARQFGAELGFAFQVADDLLDSREGSIEKGSFPELLGLSDTKKLLEQVSERAHSLLKQLGINEGPLHSLVEYNHHRKA